MSLTLTSYPVTGTEGNYQNTFPSQQPLTVDFTRVDAVITSIISGTNNKVRMAISGTFTDIQVGQFVTWFTDGYGIRSSRVLVIVDPSTIEVDLTFFSTNVDNSFVNYFRNYFVELRYVLANSVTNDQDALTLIEDFSQVPNNPDGTIEVNINAPSQLLSPNFPTVSGTVSGLFTDFKIQYRESYDGNRDAAWISPVVDVPVLLVHGSGTLEAQDFTDTEITKRFIKGYPLYYSLIYSDVNDNGVNALAISIIERSLNKTVLATTEVSSVLNFNGVYVVVVDPATINEQTAFITFEYAVSSSSAQYDPTQYDPTQYA